MRLSWTSILLLVSLTLSDDTSLRVLDAVNDNQMTGVAEYYDYFYPGLLGFKFMSTKGNHVNVAGKRMIAYGNPGSYEFFYADFSSGFNCGDRVRNPNISGALCYVNDTEFTWEFCANENSECKYNGSAIYRYGEGDKYYYIIKNNNFPCNSSNLGDPSPGKKKHCGIYTQRWTQCAKENGVCDVGSEAKLVRYGTRGKYFVKEIANRIDCNNKTWSDPIKEDKVCEYLPLKHIWVECARGKSICRFFGITIVRFQSYNGQEVYYKEAALEIECHDGKICLYARYS